MRGVDEGPTRRTTRTAAEKKASIRRKLVLTAHNHPEKRAQALGLLKKMGFKMPVRASNPTMVNRVISVEADFQTIDEWHMTDLIITLLVTAKNIPHQHIRQWLKDHWSQIQAKAPSKTPPRAGSPSRSAGWGDEYDDDADEDWQMDHPVKGLGWIRPSRMLYSDIEDVGISQKGHRVTARLTASIR